MIREVGSSRLFIPLIHLKDCPHINMFNVFFCSTTEGKINEDRLQFRKKKLSTRNRYVLLTLNSLVMYVFIELLSIFPMEIQLSTFVSENLAV